METLFAELKRYVGFDAADEAALRDLRATLGPARRGITERFYQRLSAHEGARAVFSGPEQVERLKGTLCTWLDELVAGPWDEAYFARRARIGRMHVKIGLPQRYMFLAMNQLREELLELARRHTAGGADGAPLQRAVNRILDLELAIMLETYAEASRAEVQRLERHRSEKLSALGTLAAGLAHEIRNPLNAAHLQLTLLQRRLARRQPADVEAAEQAASVISDEMERLASLVQEFLQFAKPTPPRPTKIDLRVTAESVVLLVGPEAAAHGKHVELAPGGPVEVRADDERLKQVLLNLVRNAIEAVGAGGHVRVSADERGEEAVLEVEDDGPGLPDPTAPIFEPFFTTKEGGTGLGLAIVARIVNDHDGRIAVESAPGRTVFTVRLPRG